MSTSLALAVWVAAAVDVRLGEPPLRLHPVVWIGRYLGAMGARVAPAAPAGDAQPPAAPEGRDFKSFGLGVSAWWCGAAMVLGVSWALSAGLGWALHGAGGGLAAQLGAGLVLGLLLKPLLAWRLLCDEVAAVEAALAESLPAGRARLAWLVSRDVQALSAEQVRESAIESLAENLNDSVVAPLFWFAVAGLPGAALYRFANTADAMWGYRGVREGRVWEWAGKWAAWADDALSWLPARLTALLLQLAAWRRVPGLAQQARLTPSPNSGWPMAAMARLLGVTLGKPGVYTLNAGARAPTPADTQAAIDLAQQVLIWALMGVTMLVLLRPQWLT